MFMVFRHHVSVAAFTAMVADMLLCFVAVVLAAGTLEGSAQQRTRCRCTRWC